MQAANHTEENPNMLKIFQSKVRQTPSNDNAEKLRLMAEYIEQDGCEKADEINVKTDEQCRIVIDARKLAIDKEFEVKRQKTLQDDTLVYSKLRNESRLYFLNARKQIVDQLTLKIKRRFNNEIMQNAKNRQNLLVALMVQAAIKDLSERCWTNRELSRPIVNYLDISEFAWTNPEFFLHFGICQNGVEQSAICLQADYERSYRNANESMIECVLSYGWCHSERFHSDRMELLQTFATGLLIVDNGILEPCVVFRVQDCDFRGVAKLLARVKDNYSKITGLPIELILDENPLPPETGGGVQLRTPNHRIYVNNFMSRKIEPIVDWCQPIIRMELFNDKVHSLQIADQQSRSDYQSLTSSKADRCSFSSEDSQI